VLFPLHLLRTAEHERELAIFEAMEREIDRAKEESNGNRFIARFIGAGALGLVLSPVTGPIGFLAGLIGGWL
jgi:hypothetical protein